MCIIFEDVWFLICRVREGILVGEMLFINEEVRKEFNFRRRI